MYIHVSAVYSVLEKCTYYVDSHLPLIHSPYRILPHNSIVFSAVDRMQKALNLSAPFITIYARIERLTQKDVKKGGKMEVFFSILTSCAQ